MNKGGRIFRGLKAFSQGFFIGVPLCLTFTDNIFTVCQVEGISMQPILNCDRRKKDFVLISRWKAKHFNKIERGDIVSVISPKDPNTVFIKRIIALQGDAVRTLSCKHGSIIKVPTGHCWIEGDNHKHSLDSNSFGSVPLGLVNGVATRIVWPPSRWGKLSTQIPPGRNPFGYMPTTDSHLKTIDLQPQNQNTTSEPLCVKKTDIDIGQSDILDSKEILKQSDLSSRTTSHGKSRKLISHLPRNSARHASDIAATNDD